MQLAICFHFTQRPSSQTWCNHHEQINGDVLHDIIIIPIKKIHYITQYTETALYGNIITATASQLQCKLYLNKFSQPYSHIHCYMYSSQLVMNLHVCTYYPLLSSLNVLVQTWSIHYDQITGGVPGQHSTYHVHILNNHTCKQPRNTCKKPVSNTSVLNMRVLLCS